MTDFQPPTLQADVHTNDTVTHAVLPPQTARSGMPSIRDAAQLAGILLPQEHVEFGSRPHPIVIIRPAITALIGAVADFVALTVRVHPIIRGHHVSAALFTTQNGAVLLAIAGLLLLGGTFGLFKSVVYYVGYRVVATNRRVFVIHGILGRNLLPIGNTSMAGSRLAQGLFGRIFDFGTIVTSYGLLKDMRHPVALYRALQAVANGVIGDTWTPPIRQTVIP